jgi:hypothetical protein
MTAEDRAEDRAAGDVLSAQMQAETTSTNPAVGSSGLPTTWSSSRRAKRGGAPRAVSKRAVGAPKTPANLAVRALNRGAGQTRCALHAAGAWPAGGPADGIPACDIDRRCA